MADPGWLIAGSLRINPAHVALVDLDRAFWIDEENPHTARPLMKREVRGVVICLAVPGPEGDSRFLRFPNGTPEAAAIRAFFAGPAGTEG